MIENENKAYSILNMIFISFWNKNIAYFILDYGINCILLYKKILKWKKQTIENIVLLIDWKW